MVQRDDRDELKDVIVIGGGFAGLAAALYVSRAGRGVTIIDAGRPRNRFAPSAHGFLSRDGVPGAKILADARAQLNTYPTASLINAQAMDARLVDGVFVVTLTDDATITGRKLVLAFGVIDRLPEIPGLQERWGISVLHCPYCHGLEFGERRRGVLYSAPTSLHQAMLVADWGPTTLYLNGAELLATDREALARRSIEIEPAPLCALEGEGTELSALTLADGRRSPVEALYVTPDFRFASPLAEQLGCVIDASPIGPILRIDRDGSTTVPGVFAAGDLVRAPHSIAFSVADGAAAGMGAHRALVFN